LISAAVKVVKAPMSIGPTPRASSWAMNSPNLSSAIALARVSCSLMPSKLSQLTAKIEGAYALDLSSEIKLELSRPSPRMGSNVLKRAEPIAIVGPNMDARSH